MVKPSTTKSLIVLILGVAFCFSAVNTAHANSVTFNFSGLSAGATITQIQNNMNSALAAAGCLGCSVSVVGAAADQTWDGDGHVVGPNGQPLTLGTYGGAPNAISNSATPTGVLGQTNNKISGTLNTFLADTTDGGTQVGVGPQSEMYFKLNGFAIGGAVSFDYEIFPCATGTGGCTNPPGLTFEAGKGTTGTDPVMATFAGVTPSSSAADGSSTHSPISGLGSVESSSQYIGYYSTVALNGDTELDFLDWPATIGIDNLTINFPPPSQVPEPGTLFLVGTGLAGLYLKRKKQSA
jgi:PEP-CTERM motif